MKNEIWPHNMIVVEKVKEQKYFYCIVEVKGRHNNKQSSGQNLLKKDDDAYNLIECVHVCLSRCWYCHAFQ